MCLTVMGLQGQIAYCRGFLFILDTAFYADRRSIFLPRQTLLRQNFLRINRTLLELRLLLGFIGLVYSVDCKGR